MRFNVRVYGILIHGNKVLVSDENRFGRKFTKFPGGGLEFKEGIEDCLHREFKEELDIEIENLKLYHINENFIESAFNPQHQIISIYYSCSSKQIDSIPIAEEKFAFHGEDQIFRWIGIDQIKISDFDFPIDQQVANKLINR